MERAPTVKSDPSKPSLTVFVLLTFLFSWSLWYLASRYAQTGVFVRIRSFEVRFLFRTTLPVAGAFGPGLAAILLVLVSSGRSGVWQLLRRWFRRGVSMEAYAYALCIPLVAAVLVLFISSSGRSVPYPGAFAFFLYLAINLPFSPLGEEMGWRGFLLPRLQANSSSLRSSLIVGGIWGVWHLPIRLHSGPHGAGPFTFFALFVLNVCGSAVILTWIYNISSGSLFPVILFHSSFNATAQYLLEPMLNAAGLGPLLLETAVLWSVAITLLLVLGPNLGKPVEPEPPPILAENAS